MKITYRTHPALKYLKDGLTSVPIPPEDFALLDNDTLLREMNDTFKYCVRKFSSKIYLISDEFEECASKAAPKLIGLLKDVLKNDISDFEINATFVVKSEVWYYSFITKKGSEKINLSLFVFSKIGQPKGFYRDDIDFRDGQIMWASNKAVKNIQEVHPFISARMSAIITYFMFSKYAEVETIDVNAKSRVKKYGDKVVNELDFDVTTLDSKWFRNIVRSEGFAVRGHFRLQPKKVNGEWTKELIWINDFEKHGYTSKARILSQEDN